MHGENIRSFTDLKTWQLGHAVVLAVYDLTKNFPKEEQFGLTNQLRRAAVSITSNVAEGFNRYSRKEKAQFYAVSLGSLAEVQNQLLVARDVGYVTHQKFQEVAEKTVELSKATNGLIKSCRSTVLTT